MAALLAGCAVGPDFRPPDPPGTDRYTAVPLAEQTAETPVAGGAAQRFVVTNEIPAQWWTLFRSPGLDALVQDALGQSPTLAVAEARLRQAQENLRAQTGASYFPSVDAAATASRVRTAPTRAATTSSGSYYLYNASVNVAYTFDMFGGARRAVESLTAQVDYQNYQLEAARLALAGNIVTTAVREASLRAQIYATQEILEAAERQLGIVERQFQVGAVARTDILTQRTEVARIRANMPVLERELGAARHQLAIYTGRFPTDLDFATFNFERLQLPAELPLSLPSELVRQRPDVRAAEALLHVASANVGVATANLYPQLTLSATYGGESIRSADVFDAANRFWSVGASLLQPIFHGGELRARRDAAAAAFDVAAAQYRETVLIAFQNVADTLRALDADARALAEQQKVVAAAGEAFDLVRRQYDAGAASYLQLLDALRQFQQSRIDLAQAQAQRFADTAALFQALGGGWWNRAPQAQTISETK